MLVVSSWIPLLIVASIAANAKSEAEPLFADVSSQKDFEGKKDRIILIG
jgi:hypothetical protein